jgi:hypothetical protein
MELGTNVTYKGRSYVLLGVDPMNVSDRRAYLHDEESDDMIEVPFDEVQEQPNPQGFDPAA